MVDVFFVFLVVVLLLAHDATDPVLRRLLLVGGGIVWPAATRRRSMSSSRRGLAPDWIDRTPSMTSRFSGDLEPRHHGQLVAEGEEDAVRCEHTPERGGEGAGDALADGGGVVEHVHGVDEADDGPDDAERRCEDAERGDHLRTLLVAVRHGLDLGLHDLAHGVGIGAVDRELEAPSEERVLDRAGSLLEGQETLRRACSANDTIWSISSPVSWSF